MKANPLWQASRSGGTRGRTALPWSPIERWSLHHQVMEMVGGEKIRHGTGCRPPPPTGTPDEKAESNTAPHKPCGPALTYGWGNMELSQPHCQAPMCGF